MSFEDFFKNFDRLSFVHVNLNAFTEQQEASNDSHSHWDFKQMYGKWSVKSGLVKDHQKLFWSNPQHIINLTDSNGRQMIIALMGTDYNDRRKDGDEYATLAFHLFKVIGIKSALKVKYDADDLERIGKSGKYEGEREVTKRFHVKRGIYVIIPSTADRSVETNYLLRVFTESANGVDDDDDEDLEDDEEEDDEEEDDEEEDDDDDDDGEEEEEEEEEDEDEEADEDEEEEEEEEIVKPKPKQKSNRH